MENEPVQVVVTDRKDSPETQVLSTRNAMEANVEVVPMQWWSQVLVRTIRTYLQSLVGFIAAGGTGLATATMTDALAPLGVVDFGTLMVRAASLAVAPAVVTLLTNAIEILTRLDSGDYAKLRA